MEKHVLIEKCSDSVALHSGKYVERYEAKSPNRVINLVTLVSIQDGDKVADFGCGNGLLLEALGERNGLYHGVDFSPDFINAANVRAERNHLSNYAFFCEDIVAFCQERAEEYDIATTFDFSEHIDDETFQSIYTAIRQSMREGGRLYIHTPHLDFIVERMKDAGIMPQFPEHIAVRNADAYRALLEKVGFEPAKIKVQFIPHYNYLRALHSLSKLPLIGRYFAARLWISVEK